MYAYLKAVSEVLEKGTRKENRTGVDTVSTFNVNYEVDLEEGFPLLTTKKIAWKNIVAEVLWFLSGETTIDPLKKHGCKFWDAWANENGKVPSAYGNFWRHFPVHGAKLVDEIAPEACLTGFNDQIEWAVNELKTNPMSRRVVVSAWAPGNAQTSKLPPCHVMMVWNVQNTPIYEPCPYCDGKGHVTDGVGVLPCLWCETTGKKKVGTEPRLCLHLTQRSCDIALGVPYNIATYALLMLLFSRFTGIKPGIFAHTLVDAHAYTCKPDGSMSEYDHVPGLKEQLTREPRKLPTVDLHEEIKGLADIGWLLEEDTATLLDYVKLVDYNPHPPIKFKVAV